MHATGKHVLVNASELTGQRSGSEQIAAATTVIRRRWSIRSVRLPNDAAPHTASPPHTAPAPTRAVTIRVGTPDDAPALKRLAALDSSDVPASPVLLAEVGGEARAAISLSNRAIIADPFQPTAPLVQLLLKWAEQSRATGRRGCPGCATRPARAVLATAKRQPATPLGRGSDMSPALLDALTRAPERDQRRRRVVARHGRTRGDQRGPGLRLTALPGSERQQ